MIRKGFKIKTLPVNFSAAIVPEALCQPMQTYDVLSGSYYPERTGTAAVPLVLTPRVGYTDPHSKQNVPNAAPMLTNGHWYRFDNTTGSAMSAANEITSGADYIIDTVAGSATYGKLTIKKNVAPGNPVTYVFVATLNPTNGEAVSVTASYQARTRAIEKLPVFTLDNAREVLYNPWEDAPEFTINPAMKPLIAGATFTWESLHNNAWGEACATPLDWCLTKVGNGIKIDRSKMPDRIDLRCKAQYTVNGKTHTETLTTTMTRRLPKYWPDFVGVGDVLKGTTSLAPRAIIKTSKGVLADHKGELSVIWYNASDVQVGSGMQPVIPISSLGAVLEVGLNVKPLGGYKLLTHEGAILTHNGVYLLTR